MCCARNVEKAAENKYNQVENCSMDAAERFVYEYVPVSFPGKRTNSLVITERFNSVRDLWCCVLKSLQVGVTIVSGTLLPVQMQTQSHTRTHIQSPISNHKKLKH